MNTTYRSKLVFHAGGVLLLGMLAGIPFTMVILGELQGQVSDWRLSHLEGLLNGLLMLAVAGASGLIKLSSSQQKLMYWSLIITGYGNALYGWARGISGEQGMSFLPPLGNQISALLGGIPIFTAFALVIIMMIGAKQAIKS